MKRFLTVCLLCLVAGSLLPGGLAAQGAGTITGTVTSAGTALPVQDVLVSVYTSDGTWIGSTTTDAQGQYTSPALSSGSYIVQADPPTASGLVGQLYENVTCLGGTCAITDGTPVSVTSPNATPNINFALPVGGTISGAVRNNVSLLVPDVTVQFYGATGTLIGTTTTDENGAYVSPLLPAGSYFVVAAPPDSLNLLGQLYNNLACLGDSCVVTAGTAVAVTASTNTPSINFALRLGGTIAGTVDRASNDTPLSGVFMTFFTASGSIAGSATTDASGNYTSPPLPAGSYVVQADPPAGSGLAGQLFDGVACPGGACPVASATLVRIIVAGNQTSGINFELLPGGTITGTVTKATGGTAVTDALVYFYTSDGSLVGSSPTNGSGNYTSPALSNGSYYVEVAPSSASGLLGQLYNNVGCLPGNCTVTNGTAVAVTSPNS